MFYLQYSLKSKAAEIIAGLALTDSNYGTVWDSLMERCEYKKNA